MDLATDSIGPFRRGDPASLGFDPGRLGRLDSHLDAYVADGRLAGWSLAVLRRGEIAHLAAGGHRDREAAQPVTADTVWRIYSMSKAITSVAAMALWEQGRFELKDPVTRFLPEFANTRVWRSGSVTLPVLEPVTEPMAMWHLLSHTAGLTYGFLFAHPVDELYRRAGFEWGVPEGCDLATCVERLAELPLVFQPGTEWNYSMGTDVLGRVIEVITGTDLATALEDLVLGPLAMTETGFWCPSERLDRLATLYGAHPSTRLAVRLDRAGSAAQHRPAALLGGGGLVSTMGDYLRFTEMVRRGGELDGVRILGPRTVTLMSANHLPGGAGLSEIGRPLFSETAFDGMGFGLMGSVTLDPAATKSGGSVGDIAWGGAASTAFWIDPTEELSVVFMTQLLPSSTHPLRSQLRQLVYQAIID
jgi:CubicO group peptidase (beta-lactamase class C family)